MRYNIYMKKKSLLQTNPFLKDPKTRQNIIETVVTSSSSIEGVHAAAERALLNVSKRETATWAVASSSSSKKRR